jgi:hypothetical protein
MNIKRLESALKKFKTIKEEEFNFEDFVSKTENGCGTICCLAGWMPKLIPNAGLSYTTWGGLTSKDSTISESLRKWLKVETQEHETLLNYLFGRRFPVRNLFEGMVELDYNSDLPTVLLAWEQVIFYLKSLERN